MTYWAVVVRQLIIVGVPVIAAWILCPWRPGSPRYLSNALPGLKYALHVYCNFSLGYLMKNIDKVLLGKFHGPVLLGNYDRALHLSSMPADQLLTPLHNVVLATLSRLKSDKERFIVYYTKAVSTVTFIGTLIAVVLTLSARDLILLLLGSEWSEAGLVVMALGPGIAAMFVYSTNPWLHLSLGTPDRWMRWNILALVLTTITFIIAVPFGAVAMAIAYSARAYILMIPALWYAGRPIQFSIKDLICAIRAYFVSAIFVCVFCLYICTYWLPLKELIESLSVIHRIVMISCIASFLFILLVTIIEGSFNSIRNILSLVRIFLSRRES
jgi:PST family polysaccharide transporter